MNASTTHSMAPSLMARRRFLQAGFSLSAGAAATLGLPGTGTAAEGDPKPGSQRGMPVTISSGNGLRATGRAMELVRDGKDTLDAVVDGVTIVELDPDDMTVGYGGYPNEDGVVELDACVMHGPTYRAGAVASLQNIKTPAAVAKKVLERTDHVMLVGPGALAFAKAHGFKEENLLTEKAREAWLKWRENLSAQDDWLGEEERKTGFYDRPTGTITCLALNDKGELSGTTTTSGLAFKIPGRVGDSPIIGAGLYVDNDVGACGSTGRGEAVIQSCGSRIVVENMRHGMSPQEAVLDVLKRICDRTLEKRLLHDRGRPNFNVNFYAVNKKGEYAGAAIYKGSQFAVHDGSRNTLWDCAYLYEKQG